MKTIYSYKDFCKDLDLLEKKYENWEISSFSIEETWEKLKKRKNTFLTK